MRILKQCMLMSFLFVLMACQSSVKEANYQVVPLPQEVIQEKGNPFIISEKTTIFYPDGNNLLKRNAAFLSDYLKEFTGKHVKTAVSQGANKNGICLIIDENIENKEGYELTVSTDKVIIAGKTEAGVFYGIQTLRKAIPVESMASDISLPAVRIKDYPRFGYRGMMLDVCRHFFPVDFIKKYIDILALHNINYFHWHLTEDQGWRIEIKKYPKLTEIGSQRKETVVGRNSGEYDGKPYGGYYTQDEIREVINYAKERYITIIPEINFPGHMLAALTAYPELGCTGGPYEVAKRWGVFKDVLCIGNEDTMLFLEGVLDEVTDLFPSTYIHVGGDEAPRDRWKVCPKCQARIKKEGLKADKEHAAEDFLQSYCTQRMEKFLNSKGKRIIGWDEILEGKVAQNATVMSWRGMEGGIKAAQLHHDVIMAPTTHAYLDYYPTDNLEGEPLGIGGFVSVEKVYSMEPVPSTLKEEEKKYIIGAQGNLWTEYVLDGDHVEYMVLPRMAALAEVQWTQPEKKNYPEFTQRLVRLLNIYDQEGYTYGKHIFEVKAEFTPQPEKQAVQIKLSTVDNAPVYYTLNGDKPSTASLKYESPLQITESCDFRAAAIRPTGSTRSASEQINFNKATMKPITVTPEPAEKYAYGGPTTLVDGMRGSSSFSNGRWLGFHGVVEVVVDLQEPQEISRVSTCANIEVSSWIMGATGLSASISDDGKIFKEVASKEYPADTDLGRKSLDTYEVTFNPVKTRYVKVTVRPTKVLPKGHSGEGKPPYLFLDEIVID